RRVAREDIQLRYRSVYASDTAGGGTDRLIPEERVAERGARKICRFPARHCRPLARIDFPYLRRSSSLKRRPRLRLAQDHPPSDYSWPPVEPDKTLPLRNGLRRPRSHAGRLPGTERERGSGFESNSCRR